MLVMSLAYGLSAATPSHASMQKPSLSHGGVNLPSGSDSDGDDDGDATPGATIEQETPEQKAEREKKELEDKLGQSIEDLLKEVDPKGEMTDADKVLFEATLKALMNDGELPEAFKKLIGPRPAKEAFGEAE